MNGSVHKHGNRQGLNVFFLAFRTVNENTLPVVFDPWPTLSSEPPRGRSENLGLAVVQLTYPLHGWDRVAGRRGTFHLLAQTIPLGAIESELPLVDRKKKEEPHKKESDKLFDKHLSYLQQSFRYSIVLREKKKILNA